MKEIKHKIANYLRKKHLTDGILYAILLKCNNLFFHRNMNMRKERYGKLNKEKTFYVIRNNNEEEGLISLFFMVLKEIEYAQSKNYYPFIDFQNYKTQYKKNELINGTYNAWEYYFMQPVQYSLDEIYNSQSVVLSGRSKRKAIEKKQGECNRALQSYDFFDDKTNRMLYQFIKKNMDVQPYIQQKVESIWNEIFGDKKVIGVFVRGTDYVAFRPKNHSVQPTKEYVLDEVNKMIGKYPESYVFLVTEDSVIYSFFEEKLQDKMIRIQDFHFKEYSNDDYLYKYAKADSYQIGEIYLIKLLLLSKCHYLVSSIANGSIFTNIMNDNHYEERIVIDLGVYE